MKSIHDIGPLVEYWAHDEYFDLATRQEIQALIRDRNDTELLDRFYQDLEFGTGGLRGILGAGINRMNIYTVRRAGQGLANYLKSNFAGMGEIKLSISYDNRHQSLEFARETACVMAANGITAYLFPELMPTPILSFSVRYLKAQAGVMITASHNPPQYNGYKVYWEDGAQIIAPHDIGIIEQVVAISDYRAIQWIDFQTGIKQARIRIIESDLLDAYYGQVGSLRYRDSVDLSLPIIYTSLHGTGLKPVLHSLKQRGFTNVKTVPGQTPYDPDFSTVSSPNPENKEALKLAETYARENQGEIIVATDPDSDRMAVVVFHQGDYHYLNGNQTSAIMAYYVFESLRATNQLPSRPVLIKTVVTSDLQNQIAADYQAECIEVLTGFKYIAEQIRIFESESPDPRHYVFGSEESYGYLLGTFVRDKDAITAVTTLCEMAAYYKTQGLTLIDVLHSLYDRFGYFTDSLINVSLSGQEGQTRIKTIMQTLRDNPPLTIMDREVVEIRDYQTRQSTNLRSKRISSLPQPRSNVLTFILDDESKISARPSGTEPKIKFYFGVRIAHPISLKERILKGDNYIRHLEHAFMNLIQSGQA
ncbi:MAG: phospho-sugar mutase [Candidatus Delongbacteria bacterium]|nr:phospho-sugar mutase [Candidatus Delongbacteria bacterium]